jgi:hypothetical protein
MNIQSDKDSWIFLNFDYINSILDTNQYIDITSLLDINADLVATNLVINKSNFLCEFINTKYNKKIKGLKKFKVQLILNYSNEFIEKFNDLDIVKKYHELLIKLKPILINKLK